MTVGWLGLAAASNFDAGHVGGEALRRSSCVGLEFGAVRVTKRVVAIGMLTQRQSTQKAGQMSPLWYIFPEIGQLLRHARWFFCA